VRYDTSDRQFDPINISPAGVHVPFSREHEQYELILTTLAQLSPQHNTPIERVVDLEEELFPQGTTIILVSPINTLSTEILELLQEKHVRGNAVIITLVGDLEEGKEIPQDGGLPTHYIGGKEKWRELINSVGGNSQAVGTSSTHIQLD
jgi:hypothetical protein